MLRLLMIADDFTGALDTGVQLAAHGIPTQVVVGQADLSACSSTVLVVDTETRHLPAAKAAKAVEELTRSAVENGVGCIYKKDGFCPARQHRRRACRPAQGKRRTQFTLSAGLPADRTHHRKRASITSKACR